MLRKICRIIIGLAFGWIILVMDILNLFCDWLWGTKSTYKDLAAFIFDYMDIITGNWENVE